MVTLNTWRPFNFFLHISNLYFQPALCPHCTSLQLFLMLHFSRVDLTVVCLPLMPTSNLHLSTIAHTHAHTCSKPFKQHSHFCTVLNKMFCNVFSRQLLPSLRGSSHTSSFAQEKSRMSSSADSGWKVAAKITGSLQNDFLKTKEKEAGTESTAICDEVLRERGKNPCKLQVCPVSD